MMLDGKTKVNYSYVLKVAIKKSYLKEVSGFFQTCFAELLLGNLAFVLYFSENHIKTF